MDAQTAENISIRARDASWTALIQTETEIIGFHQA